MKNTPRQFPLLLLENCTYQHTRNQYPILENVKLNRDYLVFARQNERTRGCYVRLHTSPENSNPFGITPLQYILHVTLDDNYRLTYEVLDQEKLKEEGFSTIPEDSWKEYLTEATSIVNQVNRLLDRIGDENFPSTWEEYNKFMRKFYVA